MPDANKKLDTFIWEGKNAQGLSAQGEIAAANLAMARIELRNKGISYSKITKKSKPLFSFGKSKKKIKPLDIALFTRQLSTMLSAGLPMVKAFEIIGLHHEKPSMEELILKMKDYISTGHTLAESLVLYPKYFDNLFCSLIDAGERSGTLETMLERIASYLEKMQALKKKIKKALMYPLIVLSAAFGAGGILLIFIVPRFQSMFSSFGADLPAFTQMVVNLSNFMQKYWWIIVGIIAGTIFSIRHFRKTSPTFVYKMDKLVLRLPIFGLILKKVIFARVTRTLATTLTAGMSIIDAFDSINKIIDNRVYGEALAKVRNDIASGQQISAALEATHLFPNLVVKMISVGEESGTLELMLNKVAGYYEEDVDSLVDNLSSLMEPLIMIVLGVIIGGFVVAMYLPIFQLGSVV